MPKPSPRPVFLNLLRIHMPVTALASIAHRLAGLLLALLIPIVLYLLDLSLRGQDGFDQAIEWLRLDAVRLLLLIPIWALSHHLLAGLRYLLIDIGIGVELGTARHTARLVSIGALLLAVFVYGSLL
jgi:succinate dehydrogenase / fumarate reductase, cytochrome b subunit